MYKFAAGGSMFDGISNIYLLSIATAILAAILAFYCSNLVGDESDKEVAINVDENGEKNNSLNDSKIVNSHELKHKLVALNGNLESAYDCNDNVDIGYNTHKLHINGLIGKLKSKRVKDLETNLTKDQLDEEKRIERKQLAAIFELLKKQEAELNMKEIDESELNAQLGLYR